MKTNAGPEDVWDVVKSWVKLHPVSEGKEGDPSRIILSTEAREQSDFTIHKNCEPESRKVKLVRFQENPTVNWGPKARAGKRSSQPNQQQKNQTKKQKKEKESAESTIPTEQ